MKKILFCIVTLLLCLTLPSCALTIYPERSIETAEEIATEEFGMQKVYTIGTAPEEYWPESSRSHYLMAVIGEKDGVRPKPAPDTVLTALKQLKMPAETAIYVGDSEVDIETAANAGMDSISVTWGFRDREFLESRGGRRFVDTPEELYDMIEENK